MADAFSPEVSDRICKHMNEDHADAVTIYAKAFGGASTALAAQMLKIDPQGMDLLVQTEQETLPVRVAFDHELQDSEDAHHTLIDMIKQARQRSS
jgi:putative heme iron utilization protein